MRKEQIIKILNNWITSYKWPDEQYPVGIIKDMEIIADEILKLTFKQESIKEVKKYKTILADPPWDYERDGKRHKGKSSRKLPSDFYPCMTLKELMALPVEEIADSNSHLYLWVTNAFIHEGHHLMEAWGFKPKTMITWVKDKFGLGWYFRGQTEHLLFGVRGSLPVLCKKISTVFITQRLSHSEKPERSFKIIEKMSPPPRIELFARQKRRDWDVWGNEVKSDIELDEFKK